MLELRLIFIIGWLVIVAIGGIAATIRAKRDREIPGIAAKAGLKYSDADPFDCTRVKFHLFSKGDGCSAEHVMWRESPNGHQFRTFDFEYYDEYKGEGGRLERAYHRSSCAMALVGSSWPEITIVREGVFEKLLNALAGGDIDFESEEFNRLFAVRCLDRRFASALIDAQMLDFLMSTKGELNFELKGRWLLVWTAPVHPRLMPGLLRVAEEFVAHIPPVVWDLYPSNFVDADGNPLPPGDDPLSRVSEYALTHVSDPLDPFADLARSPYEALERHDGVEYDLDGHPLPKAHEDPWGTGRAPHSGV
jgi:hypothetical protein